MYLRAILKVTTFSNEIRPTWYSATIASYTGTGLPPVGSPSTNGLSGVGSKVRIRSIEVTYVRKEKLNLGSELHYFCFLPHDVSRSVACRAGIVWAEDEHHGDGCDITEQR